MATVAPEKILKQLAELWVTTGKPAQGEGAAGVLRACSMTLVVLADEGEDASALGETLAALMPEHPARTILIRLDAKGERGLSDRVYAQCWMPFGQRRQICCEQVEILASRDSLADLPSVLLPLAVADLPVILWCRTASVLERAEFQALAELATRVLVDSDDLGDPAAAMRWMERAVARPRPIAGDLAWTHLTRWREMVSQLFENKQNLARLTGDVQLRLTDIAAPTVRALYFAAWIKDGLEASGVRVRTVTFAKAASPAVELNGNFQLRMERQGQRLIATLDDASQCTNLPLPNDYLLVREELGIVRRDPVFEKTLASAARLAYATE